MVGHGEILRHLVGILECGMSEPDALTIVKVGVLTWHIRIRNPRF
jgi:hypothetical protein